MKYKLDPASWPRKAHFDLFSQFDEPYFGITVQLDCTNAYNTAREKGVSFFLYSIYLALEAAQQTESFRYRIEGEDVVVYERIDAGSTIARSNETFGFIHLIYDPSFDVFISAANIEVARVQARTDLERPGIDNLIRFSSLPWLDFTSLSHASNSEFKDSCPKISFGKMTEKEGRRTMPMSVHVHHALVDGLHVGRFVERLQLLM